MAVQRSPIPITAVLAEPCLISRSDITAAFLANRCALCSGFVIGAEAFARRTSEGKYPADHQGNGDKNGGEQKHIKTHGRHALAFSFTLLHALSNFHSLRGKAKAFEVPGIQDVGVPAEILRGLLGPA